MVSPTLDAAKLDRLKKRFDTFRKQEDKKSDGASASAQGRIDAWKAKRSERGKDRGMGE